MSIVVAYISCTRLFVVEIFFNEGDIVFGNLSVADEFGGGRSVGGFIHKIDDKADDEQFFAQPRSRRRPTQVVYDGIGFIGRYFQVVSDISLGRLLNIVYIQSGTIMYSYSPNIITISVLVEIIVFLFLDTVLMPMQIVRRKQHIRFCGSDIMVHLVVVLGAVGKRIRYFFRRAQMENLSIRECRLGDSTIGNGCVGIGTDIASDVAHLSVETCRMDFRTLRFSTLQFAIRNIQPARMVKISLIDFSERSSTNFRL